MRSPLDRRQLLKRIGGGVIGTTTVSGQEVVSSAQEPATGDTETRYRQLKAAGANTIAAGEIEQCRQNFKGSSQVESASERDEADVPNVILDPETAFRRDEIADYTVTKGSNGKIREQYVVRHPSRPRHRWASQRVSADAIRHQNAGSTELPDDELDWDDLSYAGGTDIWWEGPVDANGVHTGRVEFSIDVGVSTEREQAGVRSEIRIEPGRNLCKTHGKDEYCDDGILAQQYRNRSAVVSHDWDQTVNEYSTSELVTGEPVHDFSVDSPDAASSKCPAVFEVASLAEYSKDDAVCSTGYPYRRYDLLEIKAEFTWAVKAIPGWLPPKWGKARSESRRFRYTTVC